MKIPFFSKIFSGFSFFQKNPPAELACWWAKNNVSKDPFYSGLRVFNCYLQYRNMNNAKKLFLFLVIGTVLSLLFVSKDISEVFITLAVALTFFIVLVIYKKKWIINRNQIKIVEDFLHDFQLLVEICKLSHRKRWKEMFVPDKDLVSFFGAEETSTINNPKISKAVLFGFQNLILLHEEILQQTIEEQYMKTKHEDPDMSEKDGLEQTFALAKTILKKFGLLPFTDEELEEMLCTKNLPVTPKQS